MSRIIDLFFAVDGVSAILFFKLSASVNSLIGWWFRIMPWRVFVPNFLYIIFVIKYIFFLSKHVTMSEVPSWNCHSARLSVILLHKYFQFPVRKWNSSILNSVEIWMRLNAFAKWEELKSVVTCRMDTDAACVRARGCLLWSSSGHWFDEAEND